MTQSDIIYTLDIKYLKNPVNCPNEGQPVKSQNGQSYSGHGALQVHKSGADLICGRCGYVQPTSSI